MHVIVRVQGLFDYARHGERPRQTEMPLPRTRCLMRGEQWCLKPS